VPGRNFQSFHETLHSAGIIIKGTGMIVPATQSAAAETDKNRIRITDSQADGRPQPVAEIAVRILDLLTCIRVDREIRNNCIAIETGGDKSCQFFAF
jgi:hypothetical protein